MHVSEEQYEPDDERRNGEALRDEQREHAAQTKILLRWSRRMRSVS